MLGTALLLSAQPTNGQTIQDSYTAETNGNYTQAIEIMKSLEAADSNEPFYKLRLGWLSFNSGKYSDALTYYQKAYKLSPTLEAREGISKSFMYLGLWNDAIDNAQAILKDYPQHLVSLLQIGYAQYAKKEYRAAIEAYEKVLKLYPYDLDSHAYLIGAYYYTNNRQDAKKHWLLMKKIYPASPFVTDFARAFE